MASTTTSTTTGSRLELAHHEMFSKSRPLALTHDQWAMLTDGRRRDGKIDGVMNGDGSLTVGTRDSPLPGPYHSFTPLTTVCGRLGSQPLTEPAAPVRLSPRACLTGAQLELPFHAAVRDARARVARGSMGCLEAAIGMCDVMPCRPQPASGRGAPDEAMMWRCARAAARFGPLYDGRNAGLAATSCWVTVGTIGRRSIGACCSCV